MAFEFARAVLDGMGVVDIKECGCPMRVGGLPVQFW